MVNFHSKCHFELSPFLVLWMKYVLTFYFEVEYVLFTKFSLIFSQFFSPNSTDPKPIDRNTEQQRTTKNPGFFN